MPFPRPTGTVLRTAPRNASTPAPIPHRLTSRTEPAPPSSSSAEDNIPSPLGRLLGPTAVYSLQQRIFSPDKVAGARVGVFDQIPRLHSTLDSCSMTVVCKFPTSPSTQLRYEVQQYQVSATAVLCIGVAVLYCDTAVQEHTAQQQQYSSTAVLVQRT